MARKPRIEYPGAVYHVLNCGNRHEPIFRDDQDRIIFLTTLGEACQTALVAGGSLAGGTRGFERQQGGALDCRALEHGDGVLGGKWRARPEKQRK
jgi:hypothetical protein